MRTKIRPFQKGFVCGEKVEDDVNLVDDVGGNTVFFTTTPSGAVLKFRCRAQSVGVLTDDEDCISKEDSALDEDGHAVDPYFFDPGYDLAAATGFQVWAGTRLLTECLTWRLQPEIKQNEVSSVVGRTKSAIGRVDRSPVSPVYYDDPILLEWQERISSQKANVLELGCGIGVVGTCLAHAGASVLLTDLPTLIDNATRRNIELNQNSYECSGSATLVPPWLERLNPVSIGKGWAATSSLDWTKPINQQLTEQDILALDLIIASDCVWLKSTLESLLKTVEAISNMKRRRATLSSKNENGNLQFLMSYQRRDTNPSAESSDVASSSLFTTVQDVVDAVERRGWQIECLCCRPIGLCTLPSEDNDVQSKLALDTKDDNNDKEKEVFVFAVDDINDTEKEVFVFAINLNTERDQV